MRLSSSRYFTDSFIAVPLLAALGALLCQDVEERFPRSELRR
jgi:hypothetical protein